MLVIVIVIVIVSIFSDARNCSFCLSIHICCLLFNVVVVVVTAVVRRIESADYDLLGGVNSLESETIVRATVFVIVVARQLLSP